MSTTYNRIDENTNQTIIFVAVFIVFLFIVAYIVDLLLLKNHFNTFVILMIFLFLSFSDYIFSNKLILKENKAIPIKREKNKQLYNMTENLCRIAGVPVPKIYKTPDMSINAFTIGKTPKKAYLVLTEGSLQRLNNLELEGVIAHEIAHIQNNDVMLATTLVFLLGFIRKIVDSAVKIVNSFVGIIRSGDMTESLIKAALVSIFYVIVLMGMFLVLLLSCVPLIEELVFYKISRKREFLADAEGVLFTRYPKGLADALKKISLDEFSLETMNSSTAHLYIASPCKDNLRSYWKRLFHSHPSIEKRINILKKMDEYGKISYNSK
ncbi:M48 family metalloprotease [Candidatus Parcubacteria bacterium]|nr:M48 family metalloprotease [Candidatus Parcubacteria bacterium]